MRFMSHKRASALAAALLAVAALVTAPTRAVAQVPDSAALIERGRELTRQFQDGELETVLAAFSDQMREGIGGLPGLIAFREQVQAQLGAETEVVSERVVPSGEYRVYHRSARFTNFGGSIGIVWAFDASGGVAGFSIRPDGAPGGQPDRTE